MTATRQLTELPLDRVVSLPDTDAGALALMIARDEPGLAAVVTRPAADARTPADVVRAAVDDLERVAGELLPAWLPEAAVVDRPDLAGLAATRLAARAYAVRAHYPPAFVTDLAVSAVTGARPAPPQVPGVPKSSTLPLGVRVRLLARLVAEAFGRHRAVLLLDLDGDGDPAIVAAAAEWLVSSGPAVWLVGARAAEVGHLPQIRFRPPRVPVSAGPVATGPAATGPVAGGPHPGSAVEKALEAALAAESWAAGRRWNQTYQANPLAAPVRLDLLWPAERCVVELDGPEHCHPVRFEADRQRDVQLQLDGYAVLRFTNARVVHDVGAVVHQIGSYLQRRRREHAEGRSHGRK